MQLKIHIITLITKLLTLKIIDLSKCILIKILNIVGEVAERLKAHAWKACKGVILSWVRIPFSPPLNKPLFTVLISLFLLN